MQSLSIHSAYESETYDYIQPAKKRRYTPDFPLPNGILVELKGRFESADRMKHLYFKKSRPELEVRFIFNNPNAKLYKGSKTTYAMWCEKYGFKYWPEGVKGKPAQKVAVLKRAFKTWAQEGKRNVERQS